MAPLAMLVLLLELLVGAGVGRLANAIGQVAPLALFLTSAIWLAALAEQAGLARRLASTLERAAHGGKVALFVLSCSVCALLTITVSLDGAVLLMVPLVLAVSQRSRDLSRPLLMGAVVVANAFSLAMPQGNPTNILVMERLGLSPTAFVSHLFAPAVAATSICMVALGLAERTTLRGRFTASAAVDTSFSLDERIAAVALGLAALGGVIAPWADVSPWWPLPSAAVITYATVRLLHRPRPALSVPWQISLRVLVPLVGMGSIAAHVHLGPPTDTSLPALVTLALATAALAGVANNLPASAVVAAVLGPRLLPAAAALSGLSVGSLTTPRGSVATLMAFDRAGSDTGDLARAGYLKTWLPVGIVATAAAATTAWLTIGGGGL